MDAQYCAKCLIKNLHLNNNNAKLTKFYCDECFDKKNVKKISSKMFVQTLITNKDVELLRYYTFTNKNRKTSLDNPQLFLLRYKESEKKNEKKAAGITKNLKVNFFDNQFTKSLVKMQPYQTFTIDSFSNYIPTPPVKGNVPTLPVKGIVALIPTGAGKTLIIAGIIEIESKRKVNITPPYTGKIRSVNQTIFVITPNKLRKNIQQNINYGKTFTTNEINSHTNISENYTKKGMEKDVDENVHYLSGVQMVNTFTNKNTIGRNMFFYGKPDIPKHAEEGVNRNYIPFSTSIQSPWSYRYDNNGKVVRGGLPKDFRVVGENLNSVLSLEFNKPITTIEKSDKTIFNDSITTEGLRETFQRNINLLLKNEVAAFYNIKGDIIKINKENIEIENSSTGLKIKIILTKIMKEKTKINYNDLFTPFTSLNAKKYIFKHIEKRSVIGDKNINNINNINKLYEKHLNSLKGDFIQLKLSNFVEENAEVGWKYANKERKYVPIDKKEVESDFLFDPFYGSIIIIDEIEELINDNRVDIIMLFECIKISGCRVIYLGATLKTPEYFLVMNTLYPYEKTKRPKYGTKILIPSKSIDTSIIDKGSNQIRDVKKILKYLNIEKLALIVRSKNDNNLKYIFSLAYNIGDERYSTTLTTPIFEEFGKYTISFDIKYLRDFISVIEEVEIKEIILDPETTTRILIDAYKGQNSPKILEKIMFLGENIRIEKEDIYGNPDFELNRTIIKLLHKQNGQYLIGSEIAKIIKEYIEESYTKAVGSNNNDIDFTRLMKKIAMSQGDYSDETIIVPMIPILQAMGIGLRVIERNFDTAISRLNDIDEIKEERAKILFKKLQGTPLSNEQLTVKVTDALFEESEYFNKHYNELRLSNKLRGKIRCFILSDSIVNTVATSAITSDAIFSAKITDRFFATKFNTSYIIKSKKDLKVLFKLENYVINKKNPEEKIEYKTKYLNLINNNGLQINFFDNNNEGMKDVLKLAPYKLKKYFPNRKVVNGFFFVKKKNIIEEKNFLWLEDIEYFLSPENFKILTNNKNTNRYYQLLNKIGQYEVNLLKEEKNEAQELIKNKFNSINNRLYNEEAHILILGNSFQVGIDAKECDVLFFNVPRNVVQSAGRFKRQNGNFDVNNNEYPVNIKCKCIYYKLNKSLNYSNLLDQIEESKLNVPGKKGKKGKKKEKNSTVITKEEHILRRELAALTGRIETYDDYDINLIKLPGSEFELKFPFYKVEEKKYGKNKPYIPINDDTEIEYTHEILRHFNIQPQTFSSKTEDSIHIKSCIKDFFQPMKLLQQTERNKNINSYLFTGLFINMGLSDLIKDFIERNQNFDPGVIEKLKKIKRILGVLKATHLYRNNSIGLVNRNLAIINEDEVLEFPKNMYELLFEDIMHVSETESEAESESEEDIMNVVGQAVQVKKKYNNNDLLVLELFKLNIIYNYNVVETTKDITPIVSIELGKSEKKKRKQKFDESDKKKRKTVITLDANYSTIFEKSEFESISLKKQIIIDDSTSIIVDEKLSKIFQFLLKLNIVSDENNYWNTSFSENYLVIDDGDDDVVVQTPIQFIEKDLDERFQTMLDSIVIYFYRIEYPTPVDTIQKKVDKKKFIDSLQNHLKLFTIDICPKLSKTIQFLTLFLGKITIDHIIMLKSFEYIINLITVLYKFDFSLLENIIEQYEGVEQKESEYKSLINYLKKSDFVKFLDNVEQFTRKNHKIHNLNKKENIFFGGDVTFMLMLINILYVIKPDKFEKSIGYLYSSIFYKKTKEHSVGIITQVEKIKRQKIPNLKEFLDSILNSRKEMRLTQQDIKNIEGTIKSGITKNMKWNMIKSQDEYEVFNNILKSLQIDLEEDIFLKDHIKSHYYNDASKTQSTKFRIVLEKVLLFISKEDYAKPFKFFMDIYRLVEKLIVSSNSKKEQSEIIKLKDDSDDKPLAIVSNISKTLRRLVISNKREYVSNTKLIENELRKDILTETTPGDLPFTYNKLPIHLDKEKEEAKKKYYTTENYEYFDLNTLVKLLLDNDEKVTWTTPIPEQFGEKVLEVILMYVFKKIIRKDYDKPALRKFVTMFLQNKEDPSKTVKLFNYGGMKGLTSFFKKIELKEYENQLTIIKELYEEDEKFSPTRHFSTLIQKSVESELSFIHILKFMKYYTTLNISLQFMGIRPYILSKYLFLDYKIDDLSSIIPKDPKGNRAKLNEIFLIIYKERSDYYEPLFSLFRQKMYVCISLQYLISQISFTTIKELHEFKLVDEDGIPYINFDDPNVDKAIQKITISKLTLTVALTTNPLDNLLKKLKTELTFNYNKIK